MFVQMSEEFRRESKRYNLAFTCQSCAYFLDDNCTIHYPVEPHRQETVDELKNGDRMYFCKMFEAK